MASDPRGRVKKSLLELANNYADHKNEMAMIYPPLKSEVDRLDHLRRNFIHVLKNQPVGSANEMLQSYHAQKKACEIVTASLGQSKDDRKFARYLEEKVERYRVQTVEMHPYLEPNPVIEQQQPKANRGFFSRVKAIMGISDYAENTRQLETTKKNTEQVVYSKNVKEMSRLEAFGTQLFLAKNNPSEFIGVLSRATNDMQHEKSVKELLVRLDMVVTDFKKNNPGADAGARALIDGIRHQLSKIEKNAGALGVENGNEVKASISLFNKNLDANYPATVVTTVLPVKGAEKTLESYLNFLKDNLPDLVKDPKEDRSQLQQKVLDILDKAVANEMQSERGKKNPKEVQLQAELARQAINNFMAPTPAVAEVNSENQFGFDFDKGVRISPTPVVQIIPKEAVFKNDMGMIPGLHSPLPEVKAPTVSSGQSAIPKFNPGALPPLTQGAHSHANSLVQERLAKLEGMSSFQGAFKGKIAQDRADTQVEKTTTDDNEYSTNLTGPS